MEKPVYLAAPYSHPDKTVRQERYDKMLAVAVSLTRRRILVYCPILHSRPIEIACAFFDEDRSDFGTWEKLDLWALSNSRALWVLTLPGWDRSRGVTVEVLYAREHNIPVQYLPINYRQGNPLHFGWGTVRVPDNARETR